MNKIYYMIIVFFILSHCSVDTRSGLWENKNTLDNKKKSSEINFNKELTFNEFRQNVILYGKNSKYPIITK